MSIDKFNKDIIKCVKCKSLIEYRNSREVPEIYKNCNYWNKPLTGYGNINGKLMIVGLAPAFNGGNRTGRVFTGDKSADFLVSALYDIGFANIPTSTKKDDGLIYHDIYLTEAVRCAPPDNKPSKEEIHNCEPYLFTEIEMMHNIKAILVLGKLAYDSVINYFKSKNISTSGMKFIHGKFYDINGIRLYCSYHPSPRNVNTGRLTSNKFRELLENIKNYIY